MDAKATEATKKWLEEMSDEEFMTMYEKASGTYGWGRKRKLLKWIKGSQYEIMDLEEEIAELQERVNKVKQEKLKLINELKDLL